MRLFVLPSKFPYTSRTSILKNSKKNSVALVRERTIPTERPPPVGEVSANFCEYHLLIMELDKNENIYAEYKRWDMAADVGIK
jgi:hypothetical protein